MSEADDEDERWIVVDGRRWRREDPDLPGDVAAELKHHLGVARSAIGRADGEQERRPWRDRVGLAKEGLGERGTPWWEQTGAERRARWERAIAALRES